ncbi:MAG: PAS domain-containing protein [Gammaproteobacteria bacterium]|nr:PAS domain-containing protein [Gammaproteobacteria bacterium]
MKAAQKIAHVGYWDFDVENGNLTWSDEIYRIFGRRPQEFAATYEKFLTILHPEDHEMVQKSVEVALNGKAEYNLDFRYLKPDGEIGWVHSRGEVSRDDQKKPFRFFGTQIDITSRKKREDEIRILRGILPICSFCKNIRNDKGYYEQIESYIHKHSGVDFSHTICPPCMEKHYPGEYENMILKKKG